MSTIQTGWLKNKNGERFAPKTLTSQVQTSDGVLLEDKINEDLNKKADKTHSHPDYALKSDIANIDLSNYETKSDASSKLAEAKSYADSAASTVKNDLLNGAGAAYDTLKELGDLINENDNAIDALETVASGKADKDHTHDDYALKTDVENINTVKDWNQNDETQPDYVKNRTHWIEEGIAELLAETTVTLNGGEGLIQSTETSMVLVEGETYFVTYNNEEYECVAGNYDIIGDGSMLLPTIGNLGAVTGGESSGEPFVIVYVASEHELTFGFSGLMIADINEATEATVSVSKIGKIYHKLDRNFIDYNSDWNAKEGEYGYIENRTHYDNSEVILPELSYTLEEEQEGCSIYYPITLEEGKEYIVNWNGVEYTCSVKTIEMDGYTAKYLGNYVYGAPGVDNTGEPFLIGIIPPEEVELAGGSYAEIVPLDGSTSLSISISEKDIKYLDNKYIKDMYGEEENNTLLLYTTLEVDGSGGLANANIDAIIEFKEGSEYIVEWNGVEYSCIAHKLEMTYIGLGNFGIAGLEDKYSNNEPFFITPSTNAMGEVSSLNAVFNDGSTNQSIKIYHKETSITKIDKKYLPDEVAKHTDLMLFDYVELPTDIEYHYLYHNGEDFVIVADRCRRILKSKDGIFWKSEYFNITLLGTSCDTSDFYYSKELNQVLYLDLNRICIFDGSEWSYTSSIEYSEYSSVYSCICANIDKYIILDGYHKRCYQYSIVDKTWTYSEVSSASTNSSIKEICYGRDMFVAIKEYEGIVWYSHDGVSWEEVILIYKNIRNLVYGKYNFVCSAGDNSILYSSHSSNSLDWHVSDWSGDKCYNIIHDGKKFIGYGTRLGNIKYSDDGKFWHSAEIDIEQPDINSGELAYGDGLYLYLDVIKNGYDHSIQEVKIYYSDDGIYWNNIFLNQSNININNDLLSIVEPIIIKRDDEIVKRIDEAVYNNIVIDDIHIDSDNTNLIYTGNEYVHCNRQYVYKSKDLIDWVKVEVFEEYENASKLVTAFGNERFVVCGVNGMYETTVYYSNKECKTWTKAVVPNINGTHGILDYNLSLYFINNKFVLFNGYNNKLICSDDGISWTESTFNSGDSNTPIRSLCYGNGHYVASLLSFTIYSTDCLTWTEGSSYNFSHIYFNNAINMFIGFYLERDSSKLYYRTSNDGANWSTDVYEVPDLSTVSFHGTYIYDENTFYIRNENKVYYTVDGMNWHSGDINLEYQEVSYIYYLNNKYIAVLSDKSKNILKLAHSDDFITWHNHYISKNNENVKEELKELLDIGKTLPNVEVGSLLMFDGTDWVGITKEDLIAEIIAALPSAEGGSF